jgi:hypothetical protein
VHESREKEVAKLIREGMDPAEDQDLVDARIPEDPESGSDGEEEEEEVESPGAVDFGSDVSPRGTSESGAPKCARDEAEPEPEPVKRFRGEGLGAPGVVSDVSRDADDIPTLSRREADGPPPHIAASVVTCGSPT